MIPVRNVENFTREGDKYTLLIPKFKNQWMQKWMIPPRRSKHFRIHFDETGSKVWDLIDGKRDTAAICNSLQNALPDSNPESDDHIALRVTEFLRRLYKNRFILFK